MFILYYLIIKKNTIKTIPFILKNFSLISSKRTIDINIEIKKYAIAYLLRNPNEKNVLRIKKSK